MIVEVRRSNSRCRAACSPGLFITSDCKCSQKITPPKGMCRFFDFLVGNAVAMAS